MPDQVEVVKAQVVQVVDEKPETIPGTSVTAQVQTLRVEVLEGSQKGQEVTFNNDYITLKKGETFYLRHSWSEVDAVEYYAVLAPNRIPTLLFLLGLFLVVLFVFGGRQGVRGLLALIGSLFFIAYFLLPGILAGYPPVLVAMGVSSIIIVLGSYITHGFNKTTTVAVLGMLATIVLTGALAYFVTGSARLSGMNGEEVTYLNIDTKGTLDLVGLLLGGIMIGLLGVLYDAAIGQAVAVEELSRAGNHLTPREIYKRGLRIGREHVGALVNTLAIAYVGASLPLLLLFKTSQSESLLLVINQELFATEIIRIIIGSIGVVLAVPLTTAVAVWMLARSKQTHVPGETHSHMHHH